VWCIAAQVAGAVRRFRRRDIGGDLRERPAGGRAGLGSRFRAGSRPASHSRTTRFSCCLSLSASAGARRASSKVMSAQTRRAECRRTRKRRRSRPRRASLPTRVGTSQRLRCGRRNATVTVLRSTLRINKTAGQDSANAARAGFTPGYAVRISMSGPAGALWIRNTLPLGQSSLPLHCSTRLTSIAFSTGVPLFVVSSIMRCRSLARQSRHKRLRHYQRPGCDIVTLSAPVVSRRTLLELARPAASRTYSRTV